MLSLQKSASDRTGLRYDFSSPSITSTSSTVFIPPANNVEIEINNVKTDLANENIDKGKSIIGKVLPRCGRKTLQVILSLSFLSSCFIFAQLMCFTYILSQSSFILYFA